MPHVVIHNSVSADGGVGGFDIDIGLHYEIAAMFGADVHLVGSETMLAAGMDPDDAADGALGPPVDAPDDRRPLLAVVDSRGRVRTWAALRQAPHWRDRMVALCSRATPADYLDHLATWHVDHIVAGDQRVDLAGGLAELERVYDAKRVLIDSGGTLNGVLLRAGLVDEVSLLVHPQLVDGPGRVSMFRTAETGDPVALRLVDAEPQRGGIVWLRYDVVEAAGKAGGG
jgi:2,5-diamino-6-(ribosylamino)-4(3H)-pyrimidinone 5'-phosphate reductase